MKTTILIITLLIGTVTGAQTLVTGNYTSSDGYYTVSVSQEGDEVTLTEPNKVNVYKNSGGNKYYHTEAKYAAYYIRVTGDKEYYTGKDGGQEYLFNYSGGISVDDLASGADNCPLYQKYLNLADEDEVNAQAWTFCGAAALVKCTYTEEGAEQYVSGVILTLKSMMDDTSTCPCTDVIPESVWDAN